jgi:hypothetical protein
MIERCRREIAAIEAEIIAGNPDLQDLGLALSDWSAELRSSKRTILCVPKRGSGQPPYGPTPADRATVQNLAALGATHNEIAMCIGRRGVSNPRSGSTSAGSPTIR